MERIVQINPFRQCNLNFNYRLVKSRSPTDSLETFCNLALRETLILRLNPRVAKYEIVLHVLKLLTIPEIKSFRKRVFDYLRKMKINAVANIEPTTDGFGNPTDTVHFHVLTDDVRGEMFLRDLLKTACLAAGLLSNEFRIDYRPLYDYHGYIRYFTKRDYPEKVYLFVRGSRIQRFYTIGNWFIDVDGNKRSKADIWNEIKLQCSVSKKK